MKRLATQIDHLLAQAARVAGEYLSSQSDRAVPVCANVPPEELRRRMDLSLPASGRPLEELLGDMEQVLRYSVRTGHPRFFNQLFGGVDPAAVLGEWITALTNTSMYTYEAAPVATLMELELVGRMCEMVGFTEGEGVFAPGGSSSNLMAMLAARHKAFPHVKRSGLGAGDAPVVFLSAEAHYSVQRAAVVMGLGLDACVEVPCDGEGRMRPDALEELVHETRAAGRQPFAVAATAGTTVAGAFDPVDALADVAEQHGLWLHVDASLGGSVLFSPTRRQLVAGIERADSVTWNPHKMMGVPLTCSATLLRQRGWLQETNGMNADYLFHGKDDVSYDLGDMTIQCGRRVDAFKLWFSWQAHGDEGYAARIDQLFGQSETLQQLIAGRDAFELVRRPQSTNVCFRYVPVDLRGATQDAAALARLDEVNTELRAQLTAGGRFLVNYATLDGAATFRMVATNPETTEEDLVALLDEIESLAEQP